MPKTAVDRDRFVRAVARRRFIAKYATHVRRRLIGSSKCRAAEIYDMAFRSDAEAVEYFYALHNDHLPDLERPLWLNEKVRWMFLNHPNPLMTLAADKAAVRDYLDLKGAAIAAPELYLVLDDPAELLEARLPGRFVLKPTFSCGAMHVEDGSRRTPPAELAALAAKWREREVWPRYGELHYRGMPKRWLVEEYLPGASSWREYKIFCFMGEPAYVAVITDRSGGTVTHALFDKEWQRLWFDQPDTKPERRPIPRPGELDLLLQEARRLSEDFLHVRVDFLAFDGRLGFSELTFAHAAAVTNYEPPDANRMLGDLVDLAQAPRYLAIGEAVVRQLSGVRRAA